MFHSRLIRPSARCVGQVPWTWSRLFHIRKTLCSTFKSRNDPHEGLDEQKNNLDATDREKSFTRQGKYKGYNRGAKQSDDRQYYAKQSDDRQYYAKQSDDRQYYAKQSDDRQYYAKQSDDRQYYAKQSDDRQYYAKQSDDRQYYAKQSDDRQYYVKQSDDRQYYAKQSDDRQYYDKKKYNTEYLTRKGKGYKTRAYPKDEFIPGGESEEFRRDSRMSDRYTPKWQMSERYRERANHRDEFIKDQESEEFRRDSRMSNGYTPKWQKSERYRERANHRDEFIKEQESEEFRRDSRMSNRYTPKWQMSERYRERANHRDESPDEDVNFLGHKHRFKGDKPRSQFSKTNLPRDWSESFGTLNVTRDPTLQDVLFSKDTLERRDDGEDEVVDAEDLYDSDDEGHTVKRHIPLSRTNRRHIPNWYGRRIEKLGKKGLVKEAIEVFDKWMIEQDRVKPTIFEYGVMISLLGRAGYTHKAFQLHKQIANMDLVVDAKIYSSLFNACAKSPFKEDALQRATKLRWLMIEKGFEPPLITYQAMINAFGMCGDTEMAFSLLDEALQKYRPSSNLLAVCLVACISDKEAGFRHAIQVWRKFMKLRLRPCITCYNLLLRAVKECGVGPQTPDNNLLLIETAGDLDSVATKRNDRKKIVSSLQLRADRNKPNSPSVVEVIEGVSPSDKTKFHGKKTHDMELKGSDTVNGSKNGDTNAKSHEESVDDKHWWERDLSTLSETRALVNAEISKQAVDLLHVNADRMPDLLNPFDRSLQVVSLGMIESNTDRLALIGGMKGVLANIKRIGDRAKPNIVTFTQLMLSVSPAEEEQVLEMMAVHDVEPDVDFFNQLIYKRVYREDYQSALAVKELIEERHLVPNIKTYGCLAKACRSQTDGNQLLADIEAANMWPNPLIMHSLVKNSGFNFPYKKYLMIQMKKLDVQASVSLIKIVEKHISIYKDILVEKELEGAEDQAVFESKFRDFMEFYGRWVQEISLQKPEHPWKQFQLEEDTEPQSQKA